MKHKWLFPFLALATSAPLMANAEVTADKFSAGVKLGMYMVDSAAAEGFEDATDTSVDIDNGLGFGLHGDYQIRENWYVDVEYSTVSVDAKISTDFGDASGDIDISTFAIYGAYRSTGQLYYMGKAGLICESVSADDIDESDMGLSFAIGGGYKINEQFSIEAEFTTVEKNVAFIGATARYTFK